MDQVMNTDEDARIIRLAMWSGPRNVSTALLRSWGNRSDTAVCDEPFYAHYLKETGAPHPGAEEVIADQENDWEKVAATLLGPVPGSKRVFYQKHMAHHFLPHMKGEWLFGLSHCFLIRQPVEMVVSLDKVTPGPGVRDTGLPQQVEIFEMVRSREGRDPVVVDAKDLLLEPRAILAAVCERVGVPFEESMLQWPEGKRETDGVWAKYWYANVECSTGFNRYEAKDVKVPERLQPVVEACLPYYERLAARRVRL